MLLTYCNLCKKPALFVGTGAPECCGRPVASLYIGDVLGMAHMPNLCAACGRDVVLKDAVLWQGATYHLVCTPDVWDSEKGEGA